MFTGKNLTMNDAKYIPVLNVYDQKVNLNSYKLKQYFENIVLWVISNNLQKDILSKNNEIHW